MNQPLLIFCSCDHLNYFIIIEQSTEHVQVKKVCHLAHVIILYTSFFQPMSVFMSNYTYVFNRCYIV